MIEKADRQDKGDYSCEVLSFIVLVILSALSHFWFIVIGICIAIIFCVAIAVLGQLVRSGASLLLWRPHTKQIDY